ncbi:MAG TPA: hypothetical protein DHM37_05235 [Candidatus Cloacimonas sp.]|jgi:ribosomal protein L24|nr:hypothetical protein [Candidatus Cloacimonadota bacterium]HCX73104.1 hypothetical protein [Candidatus Cloacimonas sp.]
MNAKFRDVSSGIVEARVVVEIQPGIFINEITILNRNGKLEVEMPQKNFKGKDGRMHYLDVITFADENRETLWKMELKEEYLEWRKRNKKVLVYES